MAPGLPNKTWPIVLVEESRYGCGPSSVATRSQVAKFFLSVGAQEKRVQHPRPPMQQHWPAGVLLSAAIRLGTPLWEAAMTYQEDPGSRKCPDT